MKNSEIAVRKNDAISRGVGMTTQVYAAKAENAEVWDVEGRRYIDFAGGIAVLNTGHRHPKVIDAVKKQLDCFTHTCHQVMLYENYDALAERLNKTAQELYGIENFTDMIGDETVATDPEALVEYLTEKGHPALALDPMM